MANTHITPGHNGWTNSARSVLYAIGQKERDKLHVMHAEERAVERERVELEYYKDNHCYPRPNGYFGSETDAHFYER